MFSGVAWARKSSTPASAAIAAAVIGLSPVIMTVRMPMRRSSAKRSRMPPFTMSLRWMTPSSRPSHATAKGVPPDLAISSARAWISRTASALTLGCKTCTAPVAVTALTDAVTAARIASTAPLRIEELSTSTPLMRV